MKNGRQRVDLGQLSPPQDHDVALCMYRRARSFHVIYACCVRSWSHQNRDPACMVRYTRRRLRLAQPPTVHAPCPLEATACVSLPRFPPVNPTRETFSSRGRFFYEKRSADFINGRFQCWPDVSRLINNSRREISILPLLFFGHGFTILILLLCYFGGGGKNCSWPTRISRTRYKILNAFTIRVVDDDYCLRAKYVDVNLDESLLLRSVGNPIVWHFGKVLNAG